MRDPEQILLLVCLRILEAIFVCVSVHAFMCVCVVEAKVYRLLEARQWCLVCICASLGGHITSVKLPPPMPVEDI